MSGFALVASLLILTMLALLGVSSMRATNTELQMAASIEDSARSFQAAEAGLSAAAAIVFDDSAELSFTSGSREIDFALYTPNPLAHLSDNTPTNRHNDLPVVTARISGDPEGRCPRAVFASSADLLACGAYELVSTHAPATTDAPRGAATTTLRLGIARQIINLE
jgi:hypothetical protein